MRPLLSMLLLGTFLASQNSPGQLHRLPEQHPDFGLPRASAKWLTYSPQADHVCNRIWRRTYLVDCIPSDVASALPREHAEPGTFYAPGWYFKKRKGIESDRRLFGGDGRQLPVEGFTKDESQQLQDWLLAIDGAVLTELLSRQRAAVWFQHDLLRLAQRLITTRNNPELLQPLWQCAQRIALPKHVLRSESLCTASLDDMATQMPYFDLNRSIEVERNSSRLFNAEFVQLWSSVYLSVPGLGQQGVTAWLTANKDRRKLPIGATAVLVQGIVAMDDQGDPQATELVIEYRSQHLTNRKPLAHDNPTTTRDGVDFAIWSLPRQAVRDLKNSAAAVSTQQFRRIDMESQDLFRDYGSGKHTTYAAQCTLCHRRSNSPDEAIAGFSALRTTSKPRRAASGERRRLSEREMLRFLDKLEDM
jgi:hypothetical protein